MVIPKYNPDSGTPTQVILFEMPGLSVDRDAYDENVWSAQGFVGRQPDAVAATFVNRLPYYTGNVFVDSGSTISSIWGTFMYQYIIPVVDDPVQVARVNEARTSLANGTLAASFSTASDDYYAAYSQFVNFKTDCLAKQPGGVCATQAVILREQLKRKWFNQEVARRDIAAAESKILALQIQDLRNIFAEALYNYASSERVDMGGSGFGASYYLIYLTPSNFWRWWPSTGLFDVSVYADGSSVNVPVPSGAIVTQPPTFGTLTLVNATAYSYRPNAGYTGTDRFGMELTVLVNGQNVTSTVFRSIQVIGNDVIAADTAFVSVSASAASSQTTSSSTSFASYAASSSSYSYQGWWNFQGSSSSSSSSSSSYSASSSSTVSQSTTLQFDLARVLITRPWLDTSLLSFYPVAIRNLGARGWSDGTITPAPGPLAFKFKLLPVAFLVARNIVVGTTMTTQQASYVSAASSNSYSSSSGGRGSWGGSFGPFFFGYRSSASSSTSSGASSSSSGYQEASSVSGGTISIRGPQVIGWLCTPVPPFPTAGENDVRTWEAAQIARQLAALNGTTVLTAIKNATS